MSSATGRATGWRTGAVRGLAVLVLAGGGVPLLQGAAWACSCVAEQRDPGRYAAYGESEQWRSVAAKAGTAYVGDVVRETYVDPRPDLGGEESWSYEVRVVRPLRGGGPATRTLTTPAQGSACGTRLRRGRVLVVDDAVGLCGPSTQDRVDARAEHVATAVARRSTAHVVARGESLWKVARTEAAVQSPRYEEPTDRRVAQVVDRLRAANPALRRSTALRPGQRLTVPAL